MNKNFVVSFKPLINPLDQVLQLLREFGIWNNRDNKENKNYIHFQGSNFEISLGSDLPFNGFYICVDGPVLSYSSYYRKGLVALVDLILKSEFNLKKYETAVLNNKEFELLVKNYSYEVINKEIFFTQTYKGTINLELIDHTEYEIPGDYLYFDKYTLDKSKVKNPVFALHCITEKGEIEYHYATFLKLNLDDYLSDLQILKERTKDKEVEHFLTNEINTDSKILRVRYDYDNIDALYFIDNPRKYILIQYLEKIGQ